jgi:hypothetical protein
MGKTTKRNTDFLADIFCANHMLQASIDVTKVHTPKNDNDNGLHVNFRKLKHTKTHLC